MVIADCFLENVKNATQQPRWHLMVASNAPIAVPQPADATGEKKFSSFPRLANTLLPRSLTYPGCYAYNPMNGAQCNPALPNGAARGNGLVYDPMCTKTPPPTQAPTPIPTPAPVCIAKRQCKKTQSTSHRRLVRLHRFCRASLLPPRLVRRRLVQRQCPASV